MNNLTHTCENCSIDINETEHKYSFDNCGLSLCHDCQNWYAQIVRNTGATKETISLYLLLKQKNISVELEKYDGFKTTDIAVADAKVNIEVDSAHHNTDPFIALNDLQRTYHDYKKGYLTLRVPNCLVKRHLEEAADYILNFLRVRMQNLAR